ncbi:NAD(P)H-dependent oxidoreductase [Occallatibacter riparius]|uniref:Flavodoxin-like domain-containing protein n=1 Tax=Occallatibacter riparius TaxID=1002689 RepID=A0A9J7BTY1_9BACT|nr:NAD(P)H-dependent oxidoreductase [Occallatibacter riparius]UWZ85202.1 hypothetical protein MOP44_04485 [Occallatibacter riparius]
MGTHATATEIRCKGSPMSVDDVNLLVVFYSRGGETERLAVWIAEGAVQAGASIKLRRARDIAPEERIAADAAWQKARGRMHQEYAAPRPADAEWADVIAFGTPAAPGVTSPELGAYLEWLAARGTLKARIGGAFASRLESSLGSAALADLQAALLREGMSVMATPLSRSGESDGGYERSHDQGRCLVELARAAKRARNF